MHRGEGEVKLSSDNVVKEYLLGNLSLEEQQQIEERLILNRDFFEQVMIVEDELVDEYVYGSLSENERFTQHFLSTPQQRQKLRTAKALKRYISELENEELPKDINYIQKRGSWLRRLIMAIRTPANPRRVEAK